MQRGRSVFITGASGTLGGPLSALAAGAGWEVYAGYFQQAQRIRAGLPVQLDLRDSARVQEILTGLQPDVIIHAAVTERSGPGYAEAIRLAAQSVAEAARSIGARLIALSTDLVFDGALPFYDEETPPRPALGSAYGQAKASAEHLIALLDPAALIVRTSLIYDFDPVNAQVAWMLRAIAQGQPVQLYTDQIRCPIWAENLAHILLELADTDLSGLLHAVGPEPLSRYDLGCALLEAVGHDPAIHAVAARAPASQPRRLVLSTARAQAALKYTRLLSLAEAHALWQSRSGAA